MLKMVEIYTHTLDSDKRKYSHMSFRAILAAFFIFSGAPFSAHAVSTIISTTDEFEGSGSYEGLEVAPTGNYTIKEASSLTVENDIVLAGGSVAVNGSKPSESGGGPSRLIQTTPNSTQGLLLRDGASLSVSTYGGVELQSKLDLNTGTTLSVAAGDKESPAGYVSTTADAIADNATISGGGDVSSKTLTATNNSSLSANFTVQEDADISDSTLSSASVSSVNGAITVLDSAVSASSLNAKTDLTVNTAQTVSGSFAAGNDVLFTADASSANISAGHDAIIDGNIASGRVAAGQTVDFKSGTHTLSGLAGTNIIQPNNVDLTLAWGSGKGDLDAKGALTLTNFKMTDGPSNITFSASEKGAEGSSENAGSLTLSWNNEIDGNLTVSDGAQMTMLKDTQTDGWLKLDNFSISNSTLDMNSTYIQANGDAGDNGVITIGDNTSVTLRVTGPQDVDGYNYGHMIADTIQISDNNTALNLILETGALANGASDTYKILDANHIVNANNTAESGQFTSLSQNNRYIFEYLGNGEYKITNTASAADIAGENSDDARILDMASAWLDSAPFEQGTAAYEMAEHLNTLSQTQGMEKTFVNALDALAPTSAPYISALAEDNTRQFFNVIGTRLEKDTRPTWSSAYRRNQKSDSLWFQGLGSSAKYSHASGFDIKSYGGAVGIDTDPCSGCKFGVAYAYTASDIDGSNRTVDVDSHAAAVYADFSGESAYMTLIASYTRSSFDEKKDVAGLSVKADYDVDVLAGQAMIGYDLGSMRIAQTIRTGNLIPEAGIRYMYLKQKAYTDSAEQKVDSADAQTLTGVIGAQYTINNHLGKGVVFYPNLKAALTYDIIQDELESTVHLPNHYGYKISEKRMDKLGAELGAELGFKFGNVIDLSISYLGTFKKDYTDHTGFVNLKAHF